MDLLKNIAGTMAVLAFIGAVWYSMYYYLLIPRVAINENDKCEWVDYAGVRSSCPAQLPDKYISFPVLSKAAQKEAIR